MSELVSWIEITKNGITRYFFLTDREVYGQRGRRLFKDFKDSSVLGHNAVRRYYNLQSNIGRNCTADLWETELLPSEIAALVVTPDAFEENFGRTFRSAQFPASFLRRMYLCSPSECLRKKAAEKLLATEELDYFDHARICRYDPDVYYDSAHAKCYEGSNACLLA